MKHMTMFHEKEGMAPQMEVPTNITHQDHWTGVWQEIMDKERAYEALDMSPAKYKVKCSVCKP